VSCLAFCSPSVFVFNLEYIEARRELIHNITAVVPQHHRNGYAAPRSMIYALSAFMFNESCGGMNVPCERQIHYFNKEKEPWRIRIEPQLHLNPCSP
jgi:hypothetical protein